MESWQLNFPLPATLKEGKYRAKWAIHCVVPGWPTLNSSSCVLAIGD